MFERINEAADDFIRWSKKLEDAKKSGKIHLAFSHALRVREANEELERATNHHLNIYYHKLWNQSSN